MRQLRFMVVCILPVATSCGLFLGGAWNWLGLAVYIALYLVADSIVPKHAAPPALRGGSLLDALLYVPVPLVLIAWLGFLVGFSGAGGFLATLDVWAGTAMLERQGAASVSDLVGASLSFAVTVAGAGTVTAHELVHRTGSPSSVFSGRVLLAFLFDTAFAIQHVYGHHATVSTPQDASTARRGENLYRFIARTNVWSFLSAWEIERKRLARRSLPLWSWHNRNLRGFALSLGYVAATAAAVGAPGTLAFILCGLFAKTMLEMTQYVEHYGLARVPGTRIEPRHSWDTAAPISAIGMFNLSRHAAHHVATRPYWALDLEDNSPKLPGGLTLSIAIAAVPPIWQRKMTKRLARWDREQATEAERELAIAAGRADRRWPGLSTGHPAQA